MIERYQFSHLSSGQVRKSTLDPLILYKLQIEVLVTAASVSTDTN